MTVTGSRGPAAGAIRPLPQPEPGLTVDDFIERARALRPRLRAEQAETEKRSTYSPELHEEFARLGFYRMLQPRALGGYELSIKDFFRVIIEIAQGCPSTGWCLCLGSAHVVNLAGRFSARVQQEVMGDHGHFVAPSRIVPSVQATPTADGWELNGLWDYCSGVPYSTHVFNAVMLPPAEGGMPRAGFALVPRDQYEILDDWGSLIGLKGSGSNSVRVQGAKIPKDYVLEYDVPSARLANSVGMELYGNSMYTGPIQSFFFTELNTVAVGITKAMFDEYHETMTTKRPMMRPDIFRNQDPYYLQWYGEATTLIDAAEACVLTVADRYQELCDGAVRGELEFDAEREQRLVALALRAGKLATEAMDILARVTGSSAMKDGSRTQRYWRDFSMFRSHVAASMDAATNSQYAALATGSHLPGPGDLKGEVQ